MADYNLDLTALIPDVRDGLADAPFDMLDDKLIFKDLQDAFDFVCMVIADDINIRSVRRCTIRLATYISYKNYVSLSERRLGTLPESSPIMLQTLLMQAYNCLSYIAAVPINTDLSLNTDNLGSPCEGSLSPSMISP
jgi:hypothetical protein